jgi:hypothetical protein
VIEKNKLCCSVLYRDCFYRRWERISVSSWITNVKLLHVLKMQRGNSYFSIERQLRVYSDRQLFWLRAPTCPFFWANSRIVHKPRNCYGHRQWRRIFWRQGCVITMAAPNRNYEFKKSDRKPDNSINTTLSFSPNMCHYICSAGVGE